MLTIFAMPKAFTGHSAVIQRNAIRSWTLLQPRPEILLLGDDEGTKEASEEFGTTYIPDIARSEYGTPLLDSIFQVAQDAASNPLVCYVNSDIILMSDFMAGVKSVADREDIFVLSGQRWNLGVTEPIDFQEDWEETLRARISANGGLHDRTGTDYYVFPKGVYYDIPAFAIGRTAWDQWLLYSARGRGIPLIDGTPQILDIHQNHDYSHGDGAEMVWNGPESKKNLALAGGKTYLFMIKDRTHQLTPDGPRTVKDLWTLWRFVRTAEVMYPRWPLPAKIAMRGLNAAINMSRGLLMASGIKRPYKIPGMDHNLSDESTSETSR
jgi:hypothetical protein